MLIATHNVRISIVAMALVAACSFANVEAYGQQFTIGPDSTTWPSDSWTRGDQYSTYAAWDVFESATEPNSPDIDNYDAASATVVETTGMGFVTSGGNIYSFAGATDFEVVMPAANLGSTADTTFVMQLITLGSEVDYNSVLLSYDEGAQQIAPDSQVELGRTDAQGGFGGERVTMLFSWDLAGVSPESFLLEFAASASSMSLDELILDTLATVADVAPMPGDFDGSGSVDASDFTYWKSQLGTSDSAADANSDGVVDLADYVVWRNNLSTGSSSSLASATATVPEPTAAVLMALLAVLGGVKRGYVRQAGRSGEDGIQS